MNSFVYMLEGKAAIGPGRGEKEQIDAHNTITLTKVLHHRNIFRAFIVLAVSLDYLSRLDFFCFFPVFQVPAFG